MCDYLCTLSATFLFWADRCLLPSSMAYYRAVVVMFAAPDIYVPVLQRDTKFYFTNLGRRQRFRRFPRPSGAAPRRFRRQLSGESGRLRLRRCAGPLPAQRSASREQLFLVFFFFLHGIVACGAIRDEQR